MSQKSGPLDGRTAIVTGVSRRIGIGYAIAQRLLADGANVFVQSFTPHDAGQPWGADPAGIDGVIESLGADAPGRVGHLEIDLVDPTAPGSVITAACAAFGPVDIVIANHARSSSGTVLDVTARELDDSFAVNTRATVLLAQAFAHQHERSRGRGRFVLFTSGQGLGAMPGEIAYVASKAANHQLTPTLAAELAEHDISVNCINPGPTDTGYAHGDDHAFVLGKMPFGRWGQPTDVANLVAFLVGDDGAWITGQVINSEGGFRR